MDRAGDFWSGIEDLGLGDVPVTSSRSARCSAPGGFASSAIPTIPLAHPSVAKPPSILTTQQHHTYANSSPASPVPDGSLSSRKPLAGRMSSPGQYPPLPSPGEQDYKELYDSLEAEEAAAEATAEAAAEPDPELYNDEMYSDVREGASLQVSPTKKRLGMSMRQRPLVLSMNTSLNKDYQLQQEQQRQVASTFASFRTASSPDVHDLSSTSRSAISSVGEASGAALAHTPAHASRLSAMHMAAPPPLPPKIKTSVPVPSSSPTKPQQQQQQPVAPNPKLRVSEIDIDRVDIASDKVMQWVSAGVADFRSPRTSLQGSGEVGARPPSGGALPGAIKAVPRPSSGQRPVKHTGVFL